MERKQVLKVSPRCLAWGPERRKTSKEIFKIQGDHGDEDLQLDQGQDCEELKNK